MQPPPPRGGQGSTPPPPRGSGGYYVTDPTNVAYWDDYVYGGAPLTHDDYLLALWYAPDPFFYNTGSLSVYPWYRPRMCDGVFMCTPVAPPPEGETSTRWFPTRRVDRTGTVSLGLMTGTYLSGYEGGGGYRDFGIGLTLGYRAAEALGFELSWQYHEEYWEATSTRTTQPFAASVRIHAFPWSVLSPYVVGGLTVTLQQDRSATYDETSGAGFDGTLVGPHLGLGTELAIGFQTSLVAEGRLVRYMGGTSNLPTVPTAFQGRLGLNVYF